MPDESSPPPQAKPAELPPFPDAAWRDGFGAYRELIEPISECPLPFHFAALLAVIAAELADHARLVGGTATWTNFFIFCNGRSGTKKSTAVDLVNDHIVSRLPFVGHSRFSSVSSAEGLVRLLATRPNTLLQYDEIADLFKTASRSGQRLEPTLNKAFSLGRVEALVKKERDSLVAEDYCFNFHANGTPDHVRLELSEAMFAGGLLNRFLVFGAAPTGRSLPMMLEPDATVATAIAAWIASTVGAWRAISAGRGSIRVGVTPEAQAVHAEWYHQHTKALNAMEDMDARTLTRVDVYAKKLAMVYALIENTPSLAPLITAEQMAAAIAVMGYCQESMLWTARVWSGPKSMGQQSAMQAEKRVEGYLKQHGCTTERYIYRSLTLSAGECKQAVEALASAGVVRVINDRPRQVHLASGCKCFPPMPRMDLQ